MGTRKKGIGKAQPTRRKARGSLPAATRPKKKPIEQYDHKKARRLNNPPVGLVTPETDRDEAGTTYAYDPHLDPLLQWAGKAERTTFEVPTISLHVHERIDPRSIMEAVRRRNGEDFVQGSLFSALNQNPPIREAIEFYKHRHNWSNRLIAGDSLLVMNSLLQKEGVAGKVQMVYIDPPYGIKYGSNFQPFVNKRAVKDGNDEDLTAEPEMIKAFRDTWELALHSYLSYLRDRLLLAKDLLQETGFVFVQMSDESFHHVREILDEVFGTANFIVSVVLKKKGATTPTDPVNDFILWYARDKEKAKQKLRRLYARRSNPSDDPKFNTLISPEGEHKRTTELEPSEIASLEKAGWRWARVNYPLVSQEYQEERSKPYVFNGRSFSCGQNRHWSFDVPEGMDRLARAGRLFDSGGQSLGGVVYWNDWPYTAQSNIWDDLKGEEDPIYAVQTSWRAVERCILLTTDPGDIVFDPTCGSGTTAVMAEKWGRRWITCDTSRVAVTLAKQRLMTAVFDYYQLAQPAEGVDSGFAYEPIPRITLKSIANNEPPVQETLYDQPTIDRHKVRVTGPFTVEAVPAPAVTPLAEVDDPSQSADQSIARSGETRRQGEWRDELFKAGIRAKASQRIAFSRVEPMAGTRWVHADAETKEANPQRVVASFGPEHAPMEQRQVALAIEEAHSLVPRPRIVIFAAFQFDPEAAKDIDETKWPGVLLLKAQMNADLLTDDLKKKRASNESFWLIGQPDAELEKIAKGEHKGKYRVTLKGFDYYNTRTGTIDSGSADRIAMWLLDPDYDGRSLFPRQVFFPMAGDGEGWARLARNLKAEIDETLIEAYRGTTSLPFGAGKHKRAAVKIIDDRGIESFRVIVLE